MTKICPHCLQPLPKMRLGVPLTNQQARIFDLVKRAFVGISAFELGVALHISSECVRSTVCGINARLRPTGWQLRSRRLGYRLLRIIQDDHLKAPRWDKTTKLRPSGKDYVD